MSVSRHTMLNLFGFAVPMVAGVVTVPFYLRLIGNDRYGVLAIVWLFLGYFGLFDAGINRAAVYHIARLSDPKKLKERESVFWTALWVNCAFGLLGGTALYFAAKPIFLTTFKIPAEMREEVLNSLPWLAASIPVSIITSFVSGALQARDCFLSYNVLYAISSLLAQVIPLLVAKWHGPSLTWIIPVVLLARAVGMLPSFLILYKKMPLGVGGGFDRPLLRPLFAYGGWVTLTNLINPLLGSLDRMLIGSVVSAEAVTLYTVPYNLLSRFTILPSALVTSLFPKLSRSEGQSSARLGEESVLTLCAIITPLTVITIAVLPIFMRMWVGQKFAQASVPIGVVLMLGIWVNCLANIPSAQLSATNRPDLPAKFHAYEVIPFIAVLWIGLHYFGLLGAAWAWSLRVTVDAVLLFIVTGQALRPLRLLPGAVLVILSSVFRPERFFGLPMFAEAVLLVLTLLWSWQVSPSLQGYLRARFHRAAEPQPI